MSFLYSKQDYNYTCKLCGEVKKRTAHRKIEQTDLAFLPAVLLFQGIISDRFFMNGPVNGRRHCQLSGDPPKQEQLHMTAVANSRFVFDGESSGSFTRFAICNMW